MKSFTHDANRIRWFQRQEAFSRTLHLFTKFEKAIALCIFDADKSGIFMWKGDFVKISGVRHSSIHEAVDNMEQKALKAGVYVGDY